MSGFTVVLIDDEDGSEGDFVHVESFPDFASLRESAGLVTASSWISRLLERAEELSAPEPRSCIYRGIE